MPYIAKNRTKKERHRAAIVTVLESDDVFDLSSRQIRSRLYDYLKSETPSTTSVGMLCKELTLEGLIVTIRPIGVCPMLSYRAVAGVDQ